MPRHCATVSSRASSTKDRVIATGALALAGTGAFAAVHPDVAKADSSHDWSGVANCESSGNWGINTGNGFYGGVQFTQSTWAGFGGLKFAARADLATSAQQIEIAERVLAGQGVHAWPNCGKFLKGGSTPGAVVAPPTTPVAIQSAPPAHGQPTPVPAGAPVPQGATSSAVVAQARTHLGVAYAWGGDSNVNGFDCSGLVVRTFAEVGIQLPHSATQIGNMGQLVAGGVVNAQPGDVLYWTSPSPHVAIYVGDGRLIAASTFGQNSAEGNVYGSPTVRRFVTAAAPAASAPASAPATAPAASVGTYTVVKGDTLSQIAQAHKVTTMALYNANRDKVGNPNLIFPSQVLALPGSAVVPAPAGGGGVVVTALRPTSGPAHAAAVTDPAPGAYIAQAFKGAAHQGVDLAAPLGTPEYAAMNSTVEFVGSASGFGDWIVLTATVGGQRVDFVYGHEYPKGILVHVGEQLNAGDQIGNVGANGNATGPHVHFEVWIGGRMGGHPVDPAAWMADHGVAL